MLIEKILGSIQDYNLKDYKTDSIILKHDELAKPHQKTKTKSGRDVAISLPLGERLYSGAVLYDQDGLLISIVMANEELLEIYPKDNFEWAKSAFNIGNMHHPAFLKENSIVTPYDPSIERIFKTLDISYKKTIGKLEGISANVNQTLAHAHSHHHEHDGGGHGHG